MKKYKFTLVGFFLSVILWLVILVLQLDIFKELSIFFKNLEFYEIDELVLPLIILLVCIHIDRFKIQKINKIEAEKSKIYEAMLFANQHILNNFLNEMQIFKLTAEETNGFPKDVIDLYDTIISDTKKQIESLSHIDKIDADSIDKAIRQNVSVYNASSN